MQDYDVIVVGAGNAALSAAVSAHENGARRVLVLEKAPRDMRGGNTHWAGAVLRIAFDDPHDLAPLLPGIEREYESFYEGITPYTRKDYMDDLLRVTSGPICCVRICTLASKPPQPSTTALAWMASSPLSVRTLTPQMRPRPSRISSVAALE